MKRIALAGLVALALTNGSCAEADNELSQRPMGVASSDSVPVVDEVERLRALGYVHTAEDENAPSLDVTEPDLERMQPGLTYYTKVKDCSSHLIRPDGTEVHSWTYQPCEVWGNTVLLPDGSILAVHHDRYESQTVEAVADARRLLKLDWEGNLLWSSRIPVHHDVDVMPNGNIAALTYRHRSIPGVNERVLSRDHYLVELSPGGDILEQTSLTDILLASPQAVSLQSVKASHKDGLDEVDHLHSNSLEFLREPELASQNGLYASDNVLICLRHQDMVVIVDWKTKRALWSWGQGKISGPHDATLLANGNVLVFDNGLDRKWSRVVEVDPRNDEIVWEYSAPSKSDFFTITRGASQRLANGNTLITNSRLGSVFEVAPNGDVVWGFREPRTASGKPRSRIVRARRLPEAESGARPPFATSD